MLIYICLAASWGSTANVVVFSEKAKSFMGLKQRQELEMKAKKGIFVIHTEP